MNDKPLRGKTALITGASKGLGRAMALALAEAGAHLALAARNLDQLQQTAAAARHFGVEADVFEADVTDESQVTRLAQAALARFDKIQILINNAGINIRKPLIDFNLAEWRRVLDTSVTGAFLICHAFVPHMKGQGYGRILNLSSTMGHVAIPGRTAYCASKTALLGLTRALALELAPEAITVNAISPGLIGTEMNLPILQNPELKQQFLSRIPLGRMGKVEEIGALARFLCAEAAGYITGTDILIDGGWCAQ
ncbi:MAG: SDR family oxidoreductase [Verrucomicrobia bacterium]|nr:SDR family oxidoreductase [Verrucomicrobiota bacterium]